MHAERAAWQFESIARERSAAGTRRHCHVAETVQLKCGAVHNLSGEGWVAGVGGPQVRFPAFFHNRKKGAKVPHHP